MISRSIFESGKDAPQKEAKLLKSILYLSLSIMVWYGCGCFHFSSFFCQYIGFLCLAFVCLVFSFPQLPLPSSVSAVLNLHLIARICPPIPSLSFSLCISSPVASPQSINPFFHQSCFCQCCISCSPCTIPPVAYFPVLFSINSVDCNLHLPQVILHHCQAYLHL